MKLIPILLLLSGLTAVLSGCAESHADPSELYEPAPAAVYKAGHGVRLSEPARSFVGLETAAAEPAADGIRIPATALLRTARGDFVYVANGEWYLRTPVTVRAVMSTQVELEAGLYEGDVVVVNGVRSLALSEIQALNGGVGCADGH